MRIICRKFILLFSNFMEVLKEAKKEKERKTSSCSIIFRFSACFYLTQIDTTVRLSPPFMIRLPIPPLERRSGLEPLLVILDCLKESSEIALSKPPATWPTFTSNTLDYLKEECGTVW